MADENLPVRSPRKQQGSHREPVHRPEPEPEHHHWPPHWSDVRDVVLFVAGLLGAAHETLVVQVQRPELLILFGTMMGLPAFLRADEKRKR